jgi:hypothetical protein
MRQGIRGARERLREEDERLRFEEDLVSEALGRKGRRRPTGGKGGGKAVIVRQQVLDMVQRNFPERSFSVPEAREAFKEEGVSIRTEALRLHLTKLAKDSKLLRDGTRYVLSHAARLGEGAQSPSRLALSNGSSQASFAEAPSSGLGGMGG